MAKRKALPDATQTEVLTRSARRCAVCFGLNADVSEKQGQIAHLDKNPENNALNNLAFLCLNHHDEYDGSRSQSKGLTIQEVKKYRDDLHTNIEQWRNQELFGPRAGEYFLQPYLEKTRAIPNLTQNELLFERGLQLIADPKDGDKKFPAVLTIFSKTSVFFAEHPVVPLPKERWLVLQAVLPGGYGSKIQVQGTTDAQIKNFTSVLKREEAYGILRGLTTTAGSEFVTIGRVKGEEYLFLGMHTVYPSYSTTDVSFFASYPVADSLLKYLDESGFSAPIEKE